MSKSTSGLLYPVVDTGKWKTLWHTRVNPVKGHQACQGLEHLTYELNLKEQGLSSLKSKWEENTSSAFCKYTQKTGPAFSQRIIVKGWEAKDKL